MLAWIRSKDISLLLPGESCATLNWRTPSLGELASNPGPHRHRIYDRGEEPLPDGRRSGGDEGLGSRLRANVIKVEHCCHRDGEGYEPSDIMKTACPL